MAIILNSKEAVLSAQKFIEELKSGELKMERLPNSFVDYSGEMEQNDYISFCDFLKSGNGKRVLEMLEEVDGNDL